MPGVTSSGAFRYGMMLWTGSWQPTVAAAPAVSPAIFKKSRRSISGIFVSLAALVVTGDAVVGRPALQMALHAPAHLELRRGQEEAALREAGLRHEVHALHVLHLAVALLARDAGLHVAHVLELHEVGHPVDPHPGDRVALLVVLVDLRDLLGGAGRAAFLHVLVTAHADRDRGHRRIPAALGRTVAVQARDAEVSVGDGAGVDLVVELDRLLWTGQFIRGVRVEIRRASEDCGADHEQADRDQNAGTLPRSHATRAGLPAPRSRVKATRAKTDGCSESLRVRMNFARLRLAARSLRSLATSLGAALARSRGFDRLAREEPVNRSGALRRGRM